MAEAVVKSEFTVSADLLWNLVRDFGNVSWMQGVNEVELEGAGPGMVRVLHVGDGPPIRERLDTVDEGTKTITYTIPQGIPFPVLHYKSKMAVAETDTGCLLEWSCTCEPDRISEGEATATIEGMYGAMVAWIKSALGSG